MTSPFLSSGALILATGAPACLGSKLPTSSNGIYRNRHLLFLEINLNSSSSHLKHHGQSDSSSLTASNDCFWPNSAIQLSITSRQYENPARPTAGWIRPKAADQLQDDAVLSERWRYPLSIQDFLECSSKGAGSGPPFGHNLGIERACTPMSCAETS